MKKVLIVDDEIDFASAVAEYLAEDGFETTVAGSAEEARKLGPQTFDVALIDLRLPGETGLELCRHIRRLNSKSTVILMSAHGTMPDVMRSMDYDVDLFIPKPISLPSLSRMLHSDLRRVNGQISSNHRLQPRNRQPDGRPPGDPIESSRGDS